MVKAQKKIIGRKALTLGVILSIGFFGHSAKGTPPNPFADEGNVTVSAARERGKEANEVITKAVPRREEVKEELVSDPGTAAATRELNQLNRSIDQHSQRTYGDADRFKDDREMQQLATNVANTAKDWPHVQAYADRWAALAKPDSPEWAKAVNTGGQAAHEAGDYKKATASALRVLERFPKDKDALFLYNSSKGRGPAVATPAPPAPPNTPPPQRVNLNNDPRLAANAQNLAAMARLREARHLLDINDKNGALQMAQTIRSSDPGINAAAYAVQAQAWQVMGDLSKAVLQISEAIKLFTEKSDLAAAYAQRASYHNGLKNHEAAVADSSIAIENNPKLALAFRERSLAFEGLREPEKALDDMNQAAALDKGFMTELGEQRLRLGQGGGSAGLARPAESALHKIWVKLRGKAGGSFTLFMGAMGALSFLIAGYVFWFAKEGSTASRMKSWFTPSSRAETAVRNGQDDVIGKTVGGHIEIQSVRDRGGMGVIYEGFDRNLKRPVALKRLLPELQSEDLLKRILAEAQTLALFHHPHIVEIYEVIMESGGIFLVQPLLDGHTVYVELNETPGRRLTTERVLEVVRAVAGAIDYSHGKGVIHRDLKPSNIMVTRDGRILLMDYGIAKSDANNSHLTKTGSSIGTPAYMAPEQERGRALSSRGRLRPATRHSRRPHRKAELLYASRSL